MKYYTEDHEWVEVNGDEAVFGISEYIAEKLGEVTYVELPNEDDDFIIGDQLGKLEADEAEDGFFELYSPISGTVAAVNESLIDDPAIISDSPEDKGWICKLVNIDTSELDDMMDEEAYQKYILSL